MNSRPALVLELVVDVVLAKRKDRNEIRTRIASSERRRTGGKRKGAPLANGDLDEPHPALERQVRRARVSA